jgi:hypothetical protein
MNEIIRKIHVIRHSGHRITLFLVKYMVATCKEPMVRRIID